MRTFRERVCYGCGKKDHFIKECPLKGNPKVSTNVRAAVVKEDMVTETEDSVQQDQGLYIEDGQVATPKSVVTCITFTSTTNFPTMSQTSVKEDKTFHQCSLPLLGLVD